MGHIYPISDLQLDINEFLFFFPKNQKVRHTFPSRDLQLAINIFLYPKMWDIYVTMLF